METSLDLIGVALRFVKYVDFANTLHRYAIFEIGRVGGNIELKALEKAYASQLCQIPGDLTNGILQQKQVHDNSGCYTVRLCLFIGNILDGADLIEKGSDATKVTITYETGNIRPSLKSIKRMTAYGRPWFERYPVDWDATEETEAFKNKLEVLAHLFEDFPHATRCANITHKNTLAFLAVRLGHIVFDIGRGRFVTIVQQKHEPELLDLILTDTSVNQVWILNQVSSIVEDEKPWWWSSGFPYVRGEDILSEIAALQIDIVTFLAERKDRYQKLAAHILENHEDSTSADTTKTEEENAMNSEKIEFPESAPKKWVSLYGDLHELFSTWCRKRGATLEEFVCSHGGFPDYPQGIYFNILRKFSSESKDKLRFTVHYDDTFKTVAIRFFAYNIESFHVTTPKERLQIRSITFCEPIFKSFIGDKPSEHQIYCSQTNGDPESKTSADWKPVDVIREYFGKEFLDKIGEIFAKYVPKETAIFEPGIILKWELCSEYKFFNELRTEIDRYFKRWFSEDVSVSQIIFSENKVAWEIQMTDDRKYRAELTHDTNRNTAICVHDDILRFFKQGTGFVERKLAMYELDYEFGESFYHGIKRIYEYIRMQVLNIVNAETQKSTLPKLALSEEEPYILPKEEFKKITEDLKKLAESTSKEEKKMNEKKEFNAFGEVLKRLAERLTTETQESKTDDPIFPHFSTSKDGVKLVTIPWDVYRNMTNTQYGMTTTIVKDRASMIMNAFWNPKTGVATILWADGSKTMSKPMEGTTPDPEIGFAICIAKKIMGGTQNKWRKWLKSTIEASTASAKKKSDKSRIKLEKQARARLDAQQITEPSDVQLTEMIETIIKENATRNRPNVSVKFIDHSYDVLDKPAPKKRPGRKKKTN